MGIESAGSNRNEVNRRALERTSPEILKYCQSDCVGFDAALIYAQSTGALVYVPAGDIQPTDLLELFTDMEMTGGNAKGEPVYLNLEPANLGRNDDRTPHGGYFVIDPVSMKVTDIIERDGTSRV